MHNALTTGTATGFTADAVRALSASKGEPDWLLEKRLAAWQLYDDSQPPFWRRTDLSGLRLDSLTPYRAPSMAGGPFAGLPAEMRLAEDERWSAGAVVQRDSAEVWRSLDRSLEGKGVIYTDLATAVRKHPDLVRRYMMTDGVAPGEDKFTALHAAYWSGGTLLYVPRDVQIALPILSLNWMDTPGLAFFSHTLIVAEAGSRVTFVEEFGSASDEARQSLHSGLVEIFVGEHADVTYAEVQNWGPGVVSLTNKRAAVGRDGSMRWVGAHLGAKTTHGSQFTTLDGPGAIMDMLGVYLATGRQHMDMNARIHHVAPHTNGNVLYRGIIRDRAHTVFQGLIKVEKDAQQTDSYLANHNLLLSPKARADSLPELEIEANDVRCTHGATVGQIDEEQLFYMRCRGLSRDEAERLIVAGFVQPVIDKIPEGGARARVTAAVQAKLSA